MANEFASQPGGRIPPHNVDAERALLGAMLLSSEVQIEAISRLTSDDFYRPAHRTIFDAMLALSVLNVKFDHLSLADKLESNGKLTGIGGHEYLIDLSNSVPTTAFWERYTDIIRRLSTYRKLITAGTQIVAMSYEAPEDAAETVGTAEQVLFGVTQERITNDFKTIESQLGPALDRLETLAENKGMIAGVATGFEAFDNLTSGLRGGDLVILAARPAVGKTAFALNVATGAAKTGVAVAFFSLEMGVEDITQRILCSEAMINLQNVRSGKMPDSQWDSVIDAMDRLSKLNIAIDDTSSLNITELRAKARRQLRDRKGDGLIIVDYLQLMQPSRRNTESRQDFISPV